MVALVIVVVIAVDVAMVTTRHSLIFIPMYKLAPLSIPDHEKNPIRSLSEKEKKKKKKKKKQQMFAHHLASTKYHF
jgi:hypothetical protein